MTLAKCGPYHSTLVQTYSGPSGETIYATSATTAYFVWGQGTRFMQAGTLKQIRFYAQNVSTVSSFIIQTWGKNQTTGLYSLANQTSNLVSSLQNGLNTIDISAQNIPVSEGQFFSVNIRGTGSSSTPVIPICTAGSWQAKVFSSQSTTASNMDWEGLATQFVGCISIEFYMDAPNVVWFGDSIISGQPESFACTDQGAGAIINYASKTTPYKFKTLSGYTYQNVGSAGDSFPNMLSRFDKDVIQKSPQYCVIEGGINNIAQSNLTPQEIADYLIDEVELAQAAGIKPILLLVLPAGHNLGGAQRQNYDTVNYLLEAYHTGVNPNFALIDAREVLGYNSGGVWYLDDQYSADHTHLNEAGQQALAQAIYDQYLCPTAIFTYLNTSSSYTVTFTDRSTGTPTSWYWDFGDGYTSTEQSPIHTYANFGMYSVKLTVTNESGGSTYISNVHSCAVTACINNTPLKYQVKDVEPAIRLVKNENPGKCGCSLDDMKESGTDITIDVLAYSISERDAIVASFMKAGRSTLYPGGVDVGWHYTGKCGDRSSKLKLTTDYPEKAYPLSFLFSTDLPFMESDVQHSRGIYIANNSQTFSGDAFVAGNIVKNYTFTKWSNGITLACPDYWRLGGGSSGGYKATTGACSTDDSSYYIQGDGTTAVLGEIAQYLFLEANKTYIIGCWVKIENRTHGTAVIGLNVDGSFVGSQSWNTDTDWSWKSFTYSSATFPSVVTVNLFGSETPNNGMNIYFDHVVVTELSYFENYGFGNLLTTTGTVATIPDVEIQAANVWEPVRTDYAYVDTTTSTSYSLKRTITINGVAGKRIRLDEVGSILKISGAATAWEKVTITTASLYGGVETQIGEWSSVYVDGAWAVTGSPLPLLAGVGESIVLKFSIRTTSGSYTATMQNMYIRTTLLLNPPIPTNVQITNSADLLTRLQMCNSLYPGSKIRINADGTGSFKYVDSYDNWDYATACYASSVVFRSDADKTLTIGNNGYITYVFDVKYPIVSIPVLALYVVSGTPHVKIAVDNGNGAPDTLYYSDINPASPVTNQLTWYLLNSTSNLTLAGNTKMYVQIFSTGGVQCVISSIYLYADLVTIDAERFVLNPGGTNTIGVTTTGDPNCYVSLFYRDRKWII